MGSNKDVWLPRSCSQWHVAPCSGGWQVTVCRGTAPSLPNFMRPTACVYGEDIAVSATFFTTLMAVIAPAIRALHKVTGMNLKHKKSLCGNETHGSFEERVAVNCPDFRDIRIARAAKCIGTMICPDGRCSAQHFFQNMAKNYQLTEMFDSKIG